MRWEILIQFILPILFLAVWAITMLLNRDAQPLPPRAGRPGGFGESRPVPRPTNTKAPARTTRDWNAPTPQSRPLSEASRAGRTNWAGGEEILYLGESQESRRARRPDQTAPARSTRGNRQSRASKSKAGPTPQAPDSASTRKFSNLVNQSLSESQSGRMDFTPLAASLSSQMASLSQPSATATPARITPPPVSPSLEFIQAAIASTERLRAQIVLNEILGPPLSQKRGKRGL